MDLAQLKQSIGASYDGLAATYERAVVPVYRPLAKRLLQFVDLRPGWQVLDAGTGTGLVALLGAPRVGKGGKMLGVDASEKMLEFARKKASQFGFAQCEFRVGDIEALDVPDATFHVALSQFAIHYTDPARSLSELYRVLQPAGKAVLQVWAMDSSPPHKAMYDVLAKYRVDHSSESLALLRNQAERSYQFRQRYGSAEAMQAALEKIGFAKVQALTEDHPTQLGSVDAFLELASASPLLNAEIGALSVGPREDYLREVRAALAAFDSGNRFEWVYKTIAVIALKSN
jgi:ubiquinone/menaquinone biosynthesis C-methylase UbiE